MWLKGQVTLILVIIGLHQGADAFPEGAPVWTCADGFPHHGVEAQTSTPPFVIETSTGLTTYTPGTTITLTLRGTSGQSFEGFLVRVQRSQANTDQEQCVGSLSTTTGNVKQLNYHATDPGAINCLTHSTEADFSSIQFSWVSPSTSVGHVKVKATVLTDEDVFWTDVALDLTATSTMVDTGSDITPGSTFGDFDMSGCGNTMGCARYPDGCSVDSCRYLVSWMTDPQISSNLVFQVVVETDDDYVALGYSRNNDMDETDTNHCIVTSGASPTFSVQHGYNGEVGGMDFNERHRIKGFSSLQVKRSNGKVYCSFSRPLQLQYYTYDPSGTTVNLDFNMGSETFTLFVATGPVFTNSDAARKHKQLPVISKKMINFSTDKGFFEMSAVPTHLKIHGSLGMIAWTAMAAFGMVLARHYRGVLGGKCLGTGAWFQLHRGFMLGTAVVCAVTIGIIFGVLQEWTHSATIHAVCGLVAMALAIFQIIIGMCRPGLDAPKRSTFNWVHRICGVLGFLIAALTVVLGLTNSLIDLVLARTEAIIIGIWLGFYLVMEILLEVVKNCGAKDQEKGSFSSKLLSGMLVVMVVVMLVMLATAIAFLAMA